MPASTQDEQAKRDVAETQARWRMARVDRDGWSYELGRAFLVRAAESGVRVLLVDLPVSQVMVDAAGASYFDERRAVVTAECEVIGCALGEWPGIYPNRWFNDFRHLNALGRKVFLSWLRPRLG
jgi:hypothetical protein